MQKNLCLALAGLFIASVAGASNLDLIGVTVLRQINPTLQGSNVMVAQVEAPENTNPPPYAFEVNPAVVGQPTNRFTYVSSGSPATDFPNSVGVESGHADAVGANFYDVGSGVAPQVAHVDNYEANYFINSIISALFPPAITADVVNQSFIVGQVDSTNINQLYDNYAAQHGTLFISGIGNGDVPVSAPATCYNGIGVGVSDGNSSFGPTTDGRSKPDIIAPGGATSFSTPYVAGAAAVLLQAVARGDGGTNLPADSDARTLKALLLNGAVKPAGWSNSPATPLDARYGAGILNVFNSWKQLSGGQHTFIESTTNATGDAHPPGNNTNNVPVLAGWDFNTIVNSGIPLNYQEQVNHYYFKLPANSSGAVTFTATLVWQRQSGQTTVNNLNLFLYNAATGNLVTCSTSAVDNVEHIFLPVLPPGRYDLQVQKNPAGQVSTSETYALAFEFFTMPLNLALQNGNVVLSWPVAPAGFRLESTTDLTPPITWTNVSSAVSISNGLNMVSLPLTVLNRFFRLQRP